MSLILTLYCTNRRNIIKVLHSCLLRGANRLNLLVLIFITIREKHFGAASLIVYFRSLFCLNFLALFIYHVLTRVRSLCSMVVFHETKSLILLTLPLCTTYRLSISWLKRFAWLRTKLLFLSILS